MRRREFFRTIGGAVAAWPIAAYAQPADRVRRIGILMPFAPSDSEMQARVRAFREELRKRGWAARVNVQFDERWTIDNMDLIRSAAANLVDLNPDAILAVGGRVIPVLLQATQSIPIVVPGGTDPVGRGWAESLARPGRNITGFATSEISIIGKMLQTLKELAPHLSRVAIICNPENPSAASFTQVVQSAAEPLGIEPTVSHIHNLADIERVILAVAAQPNSGVFIPLDVTISGVMDQTIAAIARHRLPAVYSERAFVTNGGLAYYGTDRIELYRNAAVRRSHPARRKSR